MVVLYHKALCRYRQAHAPDLFLGAYTPEGTGRKLVGYVCATLSPDKTLTHESMATHVPGSSSVCIHSVCVASSHRREGIALGLLEEYIARLERAGTYERILLIAHDNLRGLYEKAGFEWMGPSTVHHGSKPWFEMKRELQVQPAPSASAAVAPPSVPAGLWEALQRSATSRNRPVGRALAAFPNGAQDLIVDGGEGMLRNKYDLLCPKEGCGSIILKNGVGALVERASVLLEPPEHTAASLLPPLPAPPGTMNWWLVRPNAMAFENIGFSKGIVADGKPHVIAIHLWLRPLHRPGKRLKLLSCADCDLGPLGWCEEGGAEFWLAASRVSYRE